MSVNLTPQKSAVSEASVRKTGAFKGKELAMSEKTKISGFQVGLAGVIVSLTPTFRMPQMMHVMNGAGWLFLVGPFVVSRLPSNRRDLHVCAF